MDRCPDCGKDRETNGNWGICEECWELRVAKDDKIKKLAEDHWGYVDLVLIAHGEDLKTRKACGCAYKLGMMLGLSGDGETYAFIKGMFSEGVDPGSYYTKIKTHLETAYEHGLKHAKEAV